MPFFDNIADGPEFDPSLPSMKRAKLLLKCYKKLPYALAHKAKSRLLRPKLTVFLPLRYVLDFVVWTLLLQFCTPLLYENMKKQILTLEKMQKFSVKAKVQNLFEIYSRNWDVQLYS